MYPLVSFSYAVPYLAYAIFMIFLSWMEVKERMSKNVIRKISIILFLYFFGLRGFVHFDWINYYAFFENVRPLDDLVNQGWMLAFSGTKLEVIEPGYILYMSIIKTIWDNWYFFIFVCSLIDILVFDKFINRYSPVYAFSMFIFCTYSIVTEIDLLRNVKALIIFMLSFDALFNKQWWKIILLSLLGISFHLSYLIFIPFYFIGTKDFGTRTWWIIFCIINVIYLFQIPFAHSVLSYVSDLLGGRYAEKVVGYADNDKTSDARGFSIGYLMRVIMFILVVWNYRKILAYDKKLILILNIFLFYIITNIGMTDFSVFCERMEAVLSFALWIIYPLLALFFKGKNRVLYLSFVFVFCFLKMSLNYSKLMYYYENIMCGAMDYVERYNTIVTRALN